MESKLTLTPREKSPPPEAQRRIEPMTLHHTGQWAWHTTDRAHGWEIAVILWNFRKTKLSKSIFFFFFLLYFNMYTTFALRHTQISLSGILRHFAHQATIFFCTRMIQTIQSLEAESMEITLWTNASSPAKSSVDGVIVRGHLHISTWRKYTAGPDWSKKFVKPMNINLTEVSHLHIWRVCKQSGR